MRGAIDSYTVDKQKAPQTLDDLVQAGYLKAMPKDPVYAADRFLGAGAVGHDEQPGPDGVGDRRRPFGGPDELLLTGVRTRTW